MGSYADGIYVLFTTNTFHLTGRELLKYLPEMLLPQRLRGVRSLEMRWLSTSRQTGDAKDIKYIYPLRGVWADPPTNDSKLHALCRMVPEAFPNVCQLYIWLDCFIIPPERHGDPMSEVERFILRPVEDMLRILGPGRELSISIQIILWEHVARRYALLYGPELRIERNGIMEGRFWKVVGPGNELGYWICSGHHHDPGGNRAPPPGCLPVRKLCQVPPADRRRRDGAGAGGIQPHGYRRSPGGGPCRRPGCGRNAGQF